MNHRSVLASALVAVSVAGCGNATPPGGPDTAVTPAASEVITTTTATAIEQSPTPTEPTRCEVVQAHADFRTRAWFPSVDAALEWASQRSPHGFVRAGSAPAASEPASRSYVRRAGGEVVAVAEVVSDAQGRWSVDAIDTCG